ncbi:MAG: DUF4270 domain-containing protein [Bacteroidetes bacterium]|nr:DUF4270 domain-containing protein [Bacteroidota bacterium]
MARPLFILRATKILPGLLLVLLFVACTRINESTNLGGDLIPPVDNINTFETFLSAEANNRFMTDTTKVYFSDDLALGHLNDPEFGTTHADAYFNISHPSYFIYPYYNRDSVKVDSVVLSLSYQASYGDTNSNLTLRVFEISQNAGFSDTALYRYSHPDFALTGPELGNKSFQVKRLSDSIRFIQKRDTSKLANVIRIKLDTNFARRLVNYDTSNTANGGYRNDSIFKRLFRGFAVKADISGNALVYINPTDVLKNKLTVYFRYTKNGLTDTTQADYFHSTGGQANLVRRTPGGSWLSYLNNGIPNDDKLYLPATPGSMAQIRIPALDTFRNVIVHRAELVLAPLPSTQGGTFRYPLGLFLDRISPRGDTAYSFDNDMLLSNNFTSFSYDIGTFGGKLQRDSTYRFNITRYVQSLVTQRLRNDSLRIYIPIRAFLYSPGYQSRNQLFVTDRVAYGRIILAGGNYPDATKRLRLRLVYSRL